MSLGLLLAALTKRAQLPFSAWLPAAISAPTPVSALVHSSTLVTAGVYILVRIRAAGNPSLVVIGCLTIIVGGFAALLGQDAKKVVALSTLSQLGLIIFTLGTNNEILALNHLLNHAFFKSLLFIAVGTIIHSNYASQESRMGGDARSNRNSSVLGTISCLSIRGFPFTIGYASKHSIIDSFSEARTSLLIGRFVLGRVLTILYSGKLIRIITRWTKELCVIGNASVSAAGMFPLWINMVGGVSVPICIGVTGMAPYPYHPTNPFMVLVLLVAIYVGAQQQTYKRSYF